MEAGLALVSNEFCRATVKLDQLRARPERCGELDYRRTRQTEFRSDVVMPVAQAGAAHGLCMWFDSTLAEGITFSNAPGKPNLIYGQAFFPWPTPVDIEPGDCVEARLRADLVGADYVWRWSTRVIAQGDPARVKATFEQSEFHGGPLSPAMLRKQSESHVPQLGDDGRIDQLILRLMAEEKSLGDIAREVAARYPARFTRWQDALTHAANLSLRYGR